MRATIKFKGGPGSGHHGHTGRPGKRGGSSPGKGGGGSTATAGLTKITEDNVLDKAQSIAQNLVQKFSDEVIGLVEYVEEHGELSDSIYRKIDRFVARETKNLDFSDWGPYGLEDLNDMISEEIDNLVYS